MLYFEQFTDFEKFSDSKWLLWLQIICKNSFKKYDSWRSIVQFFKFHQKSGRYFFVFFNLFLKINYSVEMIKERNLSLDARFVKYYKFSSHYHKQWPVNNIMAKYSQFGQNISGISWTCSLESLWQIESITDFIILVMWPWLLIPTVNLTNEWELIEWYIQSSQKTSQKFQSCMFWLFC